MDVKLTKDEAAIIVQQFEMLRDFKPKNKDILEKFIRSLKYAQYGTENKFNIKIINPDKYQDFGTYCRSICKKCKQHTTHTNGICDECKTKLKVGEFTDKGFVAGYHKIREEGYAPVFTLRAPPPIKDKDK